ncbi:sigma-54-dependent Fis family transcriptional regulator, partial [Campylobacter jejuni]|nr:sigma-54-dependent Fis family transcriptional regulator [Campylobacter jejuni]
RELISVVQRACILSENDEISSEDLFLEARSIKKDVKNLEKELICEVLLSVDYDKDQASQILGMDIKILNEKIKKYQIKDK